MSTGIFLIMLCDIIVFPVILLKMGKRLFCEEREDGMFIRGVKMGAFGLISLEILGFVHVMLLL
ncbi:MAG: hypothetical protein KH828_12365 [Clostridiales bacterium]|nr:hypothetical protein [Clostridiales bacterium]